MENDIYQKVGASVELFSASKYHCRIPISYCIAYLVLPAVHNNQLKIYYSNEKKAEALVTWAWLTKEEIERVCNTEGRGPVHPKKWNCGSLLYISDLIAPYGNMRKIASDLKSNIFSNVNSALSVRRNVDVIVRKKNTWKTNN